MAIRGDLDGEFDVDSTYGTIIEYILIAKDWVVQQTLARLRRDLEADDREFQDRLAAARKREEAWKRAKIGRTIKRPVRNPLDCRISPSLNS